MGSRIVFFHWDTATGTLTQQQVVRPWRATSRNQQCLGDAGERGRRFIYASNRVDVGDGDIAVFAIDPESGRLTPVQHIDSGGHTPRNSTSTPRASGWW